MGHEKRQDERYNVALAARLRRGALKSLAVKVTNVSASGCRFMLSGEPLEPGAGYTMTFGRVGSFDARIQWTAGGAYGVHFEQPLPAAQLDHIRLFLSEEPALIAERDPAA